MKRELPESIAARRDDYHSSAEDAIKKAEQSTDEKARNAWLRIAQGYRDLAATVVANFKL